MRENMQNNHEGQISKSLDAKEELSRRHSEAYRLKEKDALIKWEKDEWPIDLEKIEEVKNDPQKLAQKIADICGYYDSEEESNRQVASQQEDSYRSHADLTKEQYNNAYENIFLESFFEGNASAGSKVIYGKLCDKAKEFQPEYDWDKFFHDSEEFDWGWSNATCPDIEKYRK